MRLSSKAALAILTLVIGSSVVVARTPQQGAPPDPSADQYHDQHHDQFGGPRGFGHGGPHGSRGFMGDDGRSRPDQDRGPREEGQGRWGHEGRMGMRGRGEGPRGFGLARLLRNPEIRQQLGVTADQAAKIRQEESDFRKARIRNRADLEIKHMDLQDLLSADKPDRAAIDSKLQEVSAAQLAMAKSAVDFHLTMRDALTPAQRQKLEQWMRQRREPESGSNAGPRGPRGGGPGGRGTRGGPGAPPPPSPNAPGQPPNQ
jgi:Spy/CpxP family protein refolding chaperone